MVSAKFKSLALLAINVFNLIYIVSYALRPTSTPPALTEASAYSYRTHDFPELLPLPAPLDLVPYTIEESVHYLPLGNDSEAAWLSLASSAYGFVRLGPEDRVFTMSMFHDMHCLRMINRAFSKSIGATPAHIKHCLNYIRQNVLCSPDLTLESGDFEQRDFQVERTGGTHVCKDWTAVYAFVDENFSSWSNRTGFVDPYTPLL